MKIVPSNFTERRRQNGSAVLVFITLLAIMVILVTANSKALFYLHQETKLLERQQVKRLNASQTNTIAVVESPVKPESK
jgi:type II secretory pathway component PulK